MAVIEIEYGKLESAASAAETYKSALSRLMNQANSDMGNISAAWLGDDSTLARETWNNTLMSGNEYTALTAALGHYAEYIRTMKAVYLQMQVASAEQAAYI